MVEFYATRRSKSFIGPARRASLASRAMLSGETLSGGEAASGPLLDVAIVGYGPTGATLAGLLGRYGLRVGVIEKTTGIYAQPRAVGFDHDAMRLFQRIGVAEALAPYVAPFRDGEYH